MPPEDTNTNDQEDPQTSGEMPTWDQVLAGLPNDQRALYDQHIHGLQSALSSERTQHKDLAKQLRDATSQLEAGSQARELADKLAKQLEEAEQRASFAEAAIPQGIKNPRLAYLAAQEIGAFDGRGNVNWDSLKGQFPELFTQQRSAQSNAGSGTQQPPGQGFDMDRLIRKEAGIG